MDLKVTGQHVNFPLDDQLGPLPAHQLTGLATPQMGLICLNWGRPLPSDHCVAKLILVQLSTRKR